MSIRDKFTPWTTLAIAFLVACTLTLAYVWFTAFANGGRTVVTINQFGEQQAELVMWGVVAVVVIIGVARYFQRRLER